MPTPEEKARTIKLAHQMMENMIAELGIDQYREDLHKLTGVVREDPQENANLLAVLAAARAKRGNNG